MSRRECSEHRQEGNWLRVSSSEVHTQEGWGGNLSFWGVGSRDERCRPAVEEG